MPTKYQFPIGQDWLLKPLEEVLGITTEGLCFAIATYAINKFLTQGNLTEFYDVLDLIQKKNSTDLKNLIDQQRAKRKEIYKECLTHAEKTYQVLLQKTKGNQIAFNKIAHEKIKELYIEREVHKLIDSQIQNHLISFANEDEKTRYFQIKKADLINNLTRENVKIPVDAIKEDFIYVTSRSFLKRHQISDPIEKIPAFLEELALLQAPYNYSHLFTEGILSAQNAQKVLDLLNPNPEHQVRKLYEFPGCFSLKELGDYYKSFIAAANLANTPVSLLINLANHAISLNYQPDTGDLAIIDANNLLSTVNIKNQAINSEAIINWIFDKLNFTPKGNESSLQLPPLIFTTEIYVNNKEENTDLLQWAKNQFSEQKATIQEKTKLCDGVGYTLLHIACRDGNLDLVRELINHYDNINQPSLNDGVTPLFFACNNGYLEIVRELLNKDATGINQARTTDGATPLSMACQYGYLEIVRELLNKDATSINQGRAKDGVTPFFLACQEGYLEIVKELLNHHVDATQATTDNGTTPFFYRLPRRSSSHSKSCSIIMLMLIKRQLTMAPPRFSSLARKET